MTNSVSRSSGNGNLRSTRFKRLLAAATIAYWVLLTTGTHLPGHALGPPPIVNLDKLLHFLSYGGLGALAILTISAWRPLNPRIYVRLWLFLASLAMLDEVSQFLIPGRQPSVGDWFADIIGLTAGFAMGTAASRCWRNHTDRRRLLRASEAA
jgi:VanZ family protein